MDVVLVLITLFSVDANTNRKIRDKIRIPFKDLNFVQPTVVNLRGCHVRNLKGFCELQVVEIDALEQNVESFSPTKTRPKNCNSQSSCSPAIAKAPANSGSNSIET
jgi:hypothetical protein